MANMFLRNTYNSPTSTIKANLFTSPTNNSNPLRNRLAINSIKHKYSLNTTSDFPGLKIKNPTAQQLLSFGGRCHVFTGNINECSVSDDVQQDNTMPEHVAIILDGSRRWLKAHGKPLSYEPFFEANVLFADLCIKWGVGTATTFIYSLKNLERGQAANDLLFGQLENFLDHNAQLFTRGSSTGKFTIKSALSLLRGTNENSEQAKPVWRVIWHLPVPQRVRMFMWLAAHGRLLTNTYRHMGDDPICPRCSESEEDLDHLLRSCPTSRFIWGQVGRPAGINNFYSGSVMEWLEYNASNSSPNAPYEWALEFSITCWWIWKWRNNVVFGRENDNPLNVYEFLIKKFAASKHAFNRYSILVPRSGEGGREVYVRWEAPPHGWVKLNTNGASRGNPGPAGSGGIFRDETGNFLSAYYVSAGNCNSMRAELTALLLGLKEAKRLGFRKLIVHLDNEACVSLLKKEELISTGLRGLVEDCKQLIANFTGALEIGHCYREANRAADWLANRGVNNLSTINVMLSPDSDLCPILHDDVTGVSIPRKGIRIRVIGQKYALPKALQNKKKQVEEATTYCTKLEFNLAVCYSGTRDIVDATKIICQKVMIGEIDPQSIDEALLEDELSTNDSRSPKIDLVIRTGGGLRVSDYLMWQMAQAELYFTKLHAPKFSEPTFIDALRSFQRGERSFGK